MSSILILSGYLSVGSPLFAQEKTQRKTIASELFERIETGEVPVYVADEVKLQEGETLIFDEPARVYIKDLQMEEYSVIDTDGNDVEILAEEMSSQKGVFDVSADISKDASGSDGDDGGSGSKAADGLKGSSGGHGSDGSDATDGVSGGNISLIVPQIKGDVILITKGGRGGRGGNGGDGGNGGAGLSGADARVLLNIPALDSLGTNALLEIGAMIGVPVVGQVLAVIQLFNGLQIGDGFDGYDGGNGGDAGKGGRGGNGGDGGDIELIFGDRVEGARIFVNTKGGAGGAGGVAGVAGVGGPGGLGGEAGHLWSRDGEPGNPGVTGVKALAGLPGKSGASGDIKVISTGDQQWLKCYVRYRTLLDLGMDPRDAREILLSCSAN